MSLLGAFHTRTAFTSAIGFLVYKVMLFQGNFITFCEHPFLTTKVTCVIVVF